MSTKQPVVNAKQLIKALLKIGFTLERQSGSLAIYIKDNEIRVTVPIHGKKDFGKGLLKQILSDAKISIDVLKELM